MKRKKVASRGRQPAAGRHDSRQGTLDVLRDPGLMRQIKESRVFYATGGEGHSFEDVFGEPLRPIRKKAAAKG